MFIIPLSGEKFCGDNPNYLMTAFTETQRLYQGA